MVEPRGGSIQEVLLRVIMDILVLAGGKLLKVLTVSTSDIDCEAGRPRTKVKSPFAFSRSLFDVRTKS
tara:strand:+ start:671 stop:874 length:204 start_codon:yes stop_codon:yes gene_type:complete